MATGAEVERGRGSGVLAVAGCLLAMFITAPGQTFVVSTFNGALSADLGLSADRLGLAYLIGTLCSAACLTAVGGAADRIGPRRMIGLASVGLVFAGLGFGAARGSKEPAHPSWSPPPSAVGLGLSLIHI